MNTKPRVIGKKNDKRFWSDKPIQKGHPKELMSFDLFQRTVRELLNFSREWNIDEWNEEYGGFKYGLKAYKKSYLLTLTATETIEMWAVFFYQPATKETHNYWLRSKINK